jgi:uridine phosphorylase
MNVPRFKDKWELAASYSPATFLEDLRAHGWEPGPVPEAVIFTYARFEIYLSSQTDQYTPNHMIGTGPGRFFLADDVDQRVGINCLGPGAAGTAAQLELLAELGARRFLILGTAGGLSPSQTPGEVVIPTGAVRDEGTTDHYASPDSPAVPHPSLTDAFAGCLEAHGFSTFRGMTWTTGAAFRTTADEVEHYASHGVLAVEAEAAALFVVGATRGVETAAVLVIDSVPDRAGGWNIDRGRASGVLHQLLRPTVEFMAGT